MLSTVAALASRETGDGAFVHRCLAAAVRAAKDVLGENTATLTPAQASKRAALAAKVLADPMGMWEPVAWCVAASAAITQLQETTGTIPDDAIEFTVNASWDDLAGVSGLDLAR